MILPEWYPNHPPLYDIHKTYAENVKNGPVFNGPIPERAASETLFDFLGFPVRSRLGVPAGPLLSAAWITLAAKLGFDIVTYKTIRSEAHPCHPLPNVSFVNDQGHQLQTPETLSDLTITNSFGMPSQSPDYLLQDIAKAKRSLAKGQVMIVSVVGTAYRGVSFAEDFVQAALLAKQAGADIIEANFSCPNVEKADGILYQNPETVHSLTRLIAKAIDPIPLILKVGVFPDEHQMKSMFLAAARGGARAICGINSVSLSITPALDAKRPTSGVCGGAIRPQALQFLRMASKLIRKEKLGLTLMGCGGIMEPTDFDLFLEAGAEVAMSATGMMWDPYLAMRYYAHHSQTV